MNAKAEIAARINELESIDLARAWREVENGEKIKASDLIMGMRLANKARIEGMIDGMEKALAIVEAENALSVRLRKKLIYGS